MVRPDPVFEPLFRLLREVRLRAGLTQAQVSAAMGYGDRSRSSVLTHYERGRIPNPGIRFVLDYLRACGARPADLGPFLAEYLSRPLPVPEPVTRPVRGPRVKPESEEVAALRREAARSLRLQELETTLHSLLNDMELPFLSKERRAAARYGRKLFCALADPLTETARNRRLRRMKERANRSGVPPETTGRVDAAVQGLVARMQQDGTFDRVPTEAEARELVVLSPRDRVETDEAMCRNLVRAEQTRRQAEEQALYEPLLAGARKMLEAEGVWGAQQGYYIFFVTAFFRACRACGAGTPERAERIEAIINASLKPNHDPARIHRLLALVESALG